MRRTVTPELLDSDSGSPAEIADTLADLRMINRWFGGTGTSRAMVQRVAEASGADSLSLLEVAAGSGDVPVSVQSQLRSKGVELSVTLLDRARMHLPGGRALVADALALPFLDNSFDLVSCGLFAHHLSPEQVVQFVKEGLRVSRMAVLINDLVRHRMHLALVYAGFPLYRSPMSRHDGPASVRAAYTPSELRELLRGTAAQIEIQRHYLFRMGVIAWKKELSH